MRIQYTDGFPIPLPPTHAFPLAKYRMLREAVQRLPEARHARFEVPDAARDAELELAHDPAYVRAVRSGTLEPKLQRSIGFPWSPELVERSLRSCGGTLAAMRAALDEGIGAYLGGGTHHAGRARGGGFCVFNDSAVVALVALREHGLARVLILDLDVHQGDGSAEILAHEPRVTTVSLHGARNYPRVKWPSTIDVALDDGTDDSAYLATLDATLPRAFELARPGLVIYLAGADPWRDDRFGRLALSKAGLAARDVRVFAAARAHEVPIVVTMAGGYGRKIEDSVAIQTETIRLALLDHAARRNPAPQ